MKFRQIRWRNIFSYGNKIEELNFDDTGRLWQVSGRSGSGKSSLLSLPKLLLYGKTEGSDGKTVKISEIANRINKNGWIEATIIKGSDTFVIERTFSPQSLTVYKNGENLDKAGLRDMQSIIDNEIMDNMPYHIFANVMTLSLNNFKSFISMSPNDKRQIIDKIFSLELINKVYELVRKDMRDLGNLINSVNSQIFALEKTIETSKNELVSLAETNVNDNRETIDAIKDKLKVVEELYNKQISAYQEYQCKYNEWTGKQNELVLQYNKCISETKVLQQKLNLLKQDKCPTCGTSFHSEDFDIMRDNLEKQVSDTEETARSYKNASDEIEKTKQEIYKGLQTLQSNINMIVSKKNELLIETKSIENAASKTNEFKSIQKIINDTVASKVNLENNIEESTRKMNMLEIMEDMYSNEGIKRQLMDNYIPTLNAEIKETLIALSFPYSLEFDNDFNPHLEHLGEPIAVQSLSTGEHKKVDLTVLCSILKMIKRKYPQLNLVCLDETLSSLDYESSTDVIQHLQEIAQSMNLNIFIVSHTTLDENLFDYKIFIDKNSGFSDLTYL